MVMVFHEGATMRGILAAMLPESAAAFKRKVPRRAADWTAGRSVLSCAVAGGERAGRETASTHLPARVPFHEGASHACTPSRRPDLPLAGRPCAHPVACRTGQ